MTDNAMVYVVEDDDAMRKSACLLLKTAGIPYKAFDSAVAFLDSYRDTSAGCLILDLHMPGLNGMELVQRLARDQIKLPVIVVSGTGTIGVAVEGMKLGIHDFLEKPVCPRTLLASVNAAFEQDAARREEAARLKDIRARLATLSERESELLQLLVNGLPNKLIAKSMGISIKTVENHRAKLMIKTQATNAADLVRMHMLAMAN